jgi:hypothetical protein
MSDRTEGEYLMLLKLSPLILLVIAIGAIVLRMNGILGGMAVSVVLAVVIVGGILIGIYRSRSSRNTKRSSTAP